MKPVATRTMLLLVPLSCLLSAGCGASGDFETAYAEGVVTCDGEPMTAGLLILTPVRPPELSVEEQKNLGKPARAHIQSDGSFTLGTYGTTDGAVIGKHRVHINLDEVDDEDGEQPCEDCREDLIVEIQEGSNDLKIDLVQGIL